MTFAPQNVSVYLAAFSGAMAGFGAAQQNQQLSSVSGTYYGFALYADAFAQEVDVVWAAKAAGIPTATHLNIISEASEGIWEQRSPLPSGGTVAGNYYGVAGEVVALALEGNAQVVAEGVNPNNPASFSATAATVTGGQTYQVLPTDTIVKMDSSNGAAPTATLPATPYVGELHSLFWFAWGAGQVPPVISAGANKLSPLTGMGTSGTAGLSVTTNFTQVGQFITYEWTGSEWLQVG